MILELKDIYKSFGEKAVLQGINLTVNSGEIVGLLGASGSGKSTIFNIIAGTIVEDSGEVILEGEKTSGQLGKVGYMLQDDLLLDHFTIIDNVSLPLVIKGMDRQSARDKVRDYFVDFGLEGVENMYPSQLSGGMCQRAALLRTYMVGRNLNLLDEPFSAVDMITKNSIHQWFLNIVSKYGLSAIFITHDIDEAIKLSDRIYVLGKSGKIVKELKIAEEKTDDFMLSEEFLEYKRIIYENL